MTTRFSKNTQRIAILAIAVIGALLAAFILASPRQTAAGDEHEHGAHAEHDHDGDGEKARTAAGCLRRTATGSK